MEDNGEDKVLVASGYETTHPEYNGWWVDRDKLNALQRLAVAAVNNRTNFEN